MFFFFYLFGFKSHAGDAFIYCADDIDTTALLVVIKFTSLFP
jgi:hypothetical protein